MGVPTSRPGKETQNDEGKKEASHAGADREEASEFVRGFLQHILPRGFHKVRHYGWLNPRRKVDRDEIRWLACVEWGLFVLLRFMPRIVEREEKARTCFHCGTELNIRRVTFANCRHLVDNARPYYDSG